MIITELRKRRRRLVLLVLDGEPAMTVDVRTFEESPYQVGSSLSDRELKELLEESERRRAKEKAFYLLSLRDHSRVELERKLRREASAETAADTAEHMEEWGFLNDEGYAERMARELILQKHFPRRRAVQELCARGVDRELVLQSVENVDSDDVQQALALLNKKYYNKKCGEAARQKTAAALARFGFDSDTIRRAMREWQSDEQETNDDGF